MRIPIYKVDAFTSRPFSGNPAAVCILPGKQSDGWMQNVAREMNVSETAFVTKQEEGFILRWFTPQIEVDLCGHATLASAHILWETGHLKKKEPARFHTKSGLLTAERDRDWIRMDFPSESEEQADAPAGLEEALGLAPLYVGKNRFDYLIEAETEDIVRRLQPDFGRLAAIAARGFIVTSRSKSNEFDFVSRFFAPAVGVDEDPVTGSAHCCLAPFWSKKLGKTEMTASQVSSRGGTIRVQTAGNRVYLSGQAITIMLGELKEMEP